MDQMESVNQSTEAEVSAPVEAAPEQASAPAEAQSEVTAAPEAPAYQPSWKYKANDQELELPEEYRSYIKTQEDEKRIKRLFEQVGGVEKLKGSYTTTKTELDSYKKGIEAVNKMVQTGDFMKAFQVLGWDKKMAYQAAKQFLDFDELPQQQQQVHNQAWEMERYNQTLHENYQALQEQLQAQAAQIKSQELQGVLSSPDVKNVSEKFDQQYGQGTFRRRVIEFAHAESLRRGQDITAQEAIESVLGFIKPFQAQVQPQASEPKELPVIPATKGTGASAPVKTFKSLDDLAKYRKEKYGY
jgi:hypothetical protein